MNKLKVNLNGVKLCALTNHDPDTQAPLPVIVFLHDSLGCIDLWKDFPERLAHASACRYFIYDRQGYGCSSSFGHLERTKNYLEQEADVLASLLQKQKIEKAILFGHSDGGSIALISAAKYPDLIQCVITEGAHVFVEEETLAGIKQAVKAFDETDLPKRLYKYHGEKTIPVFEAWTKTWLNPLFRDWNIEHFLPDISCPVLVIQGMGDEYGTEKQVDSIVKNVSQTAEKLMIDGAAHSPHKEARDITLEKAAAFIMNCRKA